MKATGAEDKIAPDSSVQSQTVTFTAGKLQIWDILESIYLQKGWRLVPDYKTETLVLRAEGPMTR
jgi:hypothetical protein